MNVRRFDRGFLFNIRSGAFSYEELVELANEKVYQIEGLYEKSNLPEQPSVEKVEEVLIEMREELYK